MSRDQQKAFSLVELLVGITVLTVLLSLATPSLSSFLQRSRQQAEIDQMLAALHYSRSEAVTRHSIVTMCDGQGSCNSKQWQKELMIFTDKNGNGRLDDNEVVLRKLAIPPSHHWNWSNFRTRNYISFKSNGMTHSLNGTFTLCHQNTAVRRIVINVAGRARSSPPSSDSSCN